MDSHKPLRVSFGKVISMGPLVKTTFQIITRQGCITKPSEPGAPLPTVLVFQTQCAVRTAATPPQSWQPHPGSPKVNKTP